MTSETVALEKPPVVFRGAKFRLDPTGEQQGLLSQQAGAARVAHNMMCALNNDVLDAREKLYRTLIEDGKTSAQAKKAIKDAAENDPKLTLVWRRDFARDYLTPERHRHKQAAQRIAAGEDPTVVWNADKERFREPWLHTANYRVLVSGLEQCNAALENYFNSRNGSRAGRPMGKPRFKTKRRSKDSVTIDAVDVRTSTYSTRDMGPKDHARYKKGEASQGFIADYRHVRLSHLGTFRIFGSTKALVRKLNRGGRIKSCTISRSADHWYVSFLVELPLEVVRSTPTQRQYAAGAVGVDLGVKNTATLSTGEMISNPRFLRTAEKTMKKLQRKITRCQKGSKNSIRLKQRLARRHHEIALRRTGYINELTSALASSFSAIAIEDLNVAGMTSSARGTVENPGKNVKGKAGLNRSILDISPGHFRTLLEYKCADRGVDIQVVNRFFPSSQLCSSCGSKTTIPLAQRVYHCEVCGGVIDRDVNAAINIVYEAKRLAEQEYSKRSAPEGAEDKRPWSVHLSQRSRLMDRMRRSSKALAVVAVE